MSSHPRPDTLAEVEAAVWAELAAAAAGAHPWRHAVLATVDGEHADARLVVLREVDPKSRRIVFYSDARAAKVRQIAERPRGTLVMWSDAHGWQLRCRVELATDTGGLSATSRWMRIRLTRAARDYVALHAPGTPIEEPAGAAAAASGREHFAVVHAQVRALDWLEINDRLQRRAIFDDEGPRWVQP